MDFLIHPLCVLIRPKHMHVCICQTKIRDAGNNSRSKAPGWMRHNAAYVHCSNAGYLGPWGTWNYSCPINILNLHDCSINILYLADIYGTMITSITRRSWRQVSPHTYKSTQNKKAPACLEQNCLKDLPDSWGSLLSDSPEWKDSMPSVFGVYTLCYLSACKKLCLI